MGKNLKGKELGNIKTENMKPVFYQKAETA